MYIPHIDHDRGQATVVERYPGEKLCARISTQPLSVAVLSIFFQARIAESMAVPRHLLRGR